MANHANVGFVFPTYNMRYVGHNKYYLSDGGSVYHADKHCDHIEGLTVKMVESHQIANHASTCNDCTVDESEFRKPREELL